MKLNYNFDNVKDVWNAVHDVLSETQPEAVMKMWMQQLEPVSMDIIGNTFTVRATSEFKRNIVVEKFKPEIEKALEKILGFKLDLNVFVNKSESEKDENTSTEPGTEVFAAAKLAEWSFDTFIVGPTNKFAYTAALAVANNPGLVHNPLYIYGNSGLGKTHLLKAIKNRISEINPGLNILYTSGENFMNEMFAHMSEKNMTEFHKNYRSADVLLMDDIQFISRNPTVQEEFFYTFEALINNGKQIVLISDRAPKDIQSLEDRLRSRFVVGLLADIQPPMIETRMEIIRKKALYLNMTLSDDVVKYIAENLKNNVRQIEGVVKKIHAVYSMNGETPTVMLANEIIRDVIYYQQPTDVTIKKVIDNVAKVFGVSSSDICSEKKKADISNARQVAMYIIKEITNLTLEEIGTFFGGKKHSTVIYSIEAVEAKMEDSPELKGIISDLIRDIKNEEIS